MSLDHDLPAPVPPVDLVEFWDAVEDAEFEAVVVGDAGYADRTAGWWPADPDFGAPDPELEMPGTPVDPIETVGAAGWLRQVAVAQARADARWLAAVRAVAHHGGRRDQQGRPIRDEGGVDEVAVALGWSRSAAAAKLTLAEAVIDRMPRVHTAVAAGALDLAKASVIARATAMMPEGLARAVAARVVDRAAEMSAGDVAELVAGLAVQLDPQWVRGRELAARAHARVEYARTVEGTADIAVRDLSAEAGTRARARIEALAEALRHAGRAHGLTINGSLVGIGSARAMVAQYLYDGHAAGLDDPALLDLLIADLPAWLADLHDTPESPTDDGGPDDGGPDDGGPEDGDPEDGDPDDGPGPGPDDGPGPGEGPDDGDEYGAGAVWAGTVELRVRLTTALGLDQLPAELPGSGILTAPAARAMLHRLQHGDTPVECRLVLVDGDGTLERVLLLPPPPRARRRRRTRGRAIVELAAPTSLLHALDPDDHPTWRRWLHHAQHRARLGVTENPATSLADADRRFAGRELDRYIRVRDRHCIGPHCPAPAHGAEIDHTHDWHRHGRSIAANLGAACAHCHRLKTDHGWRLTQPAPGRFLWTTPLGQTHTVAPRPVLTAPAEPLPPHRRRARVERPTHRTGPDGWTDHRPRAYLPTPIPRPPRPRPSTDDTDDTDDDPPPY